MNNQFEKKRTPTEIQEDSVKLKCKTKLEIENIRHQHIMEEIEAMKKAGIKSLKVGSYFYAHWELI